MRSQRTMRFGPSDWYPGTRGLLIASAVLSLGIHFFPPALLGELYIPQLLRPWSWFLSIFAALGGPVPFLLNAVMLMWFGNPVEGRLGTKRMLQLYLGAGVLGTLVTCLWGGGPAFVGVPAGSMYALSALFVGFGYFHQSAQVLLMFLFPVNAWNLVFYLLGFQVLMFLGYGQAHYLGSAAVTLAAIGYFQRGVGANPLTAMKDQAEDAYRRWKLKQKAAHLTVLKGGKDDAWRRDEDEPRPPSVN